VAYRFTPYEAGEKLRPEARITAAVTEGQPPLTVKFASSGGGRVRWDFGDGATSQQPNPTHVFQNPGLYSVTLTVTDASGASARSFQPIGVDRNPEEPIVRAGLSNGEVPGWTLRGSARRTPDGAFQLPAGAPWGWAQADDAVMADLRGLRSFTVLGWLKPESLKIGSGGNRVLFCLNRDRSGIDLVCHEDGRLRLAVNQWPDAIQNDSSAGKLQIGKWTFFAVTYDATVARDHVAWYFSPPMDEPGTAVVALDRRTSYNAGAVAADPGPLAVGNFNETMRDYGMDRQFRGEIRALRLFGSRVGGRGALPLTSVQGHVP
jgi:hypothetical protein